jgi:sodium/hydrogen antiporter
MTLAPMLFHDAAQLQPLQLRGSFAFTGRLLLVGLLLDRRRISSRARLFPDIRVWPALLLAAALAPTDAGLGTATVLNPVFPVRVRRILNVESGLNDGLTTQVVLFAIAATAGGRPEDAVLSWRPRQGLPCNQRERATWRRSGPRSGERLHWWIRNRRQPASC